MVSYTAVNKRTRLSCSFHSRNKHQTIPPRHPLKITLIWNWSISQVKMLISYAKFRIFTYEIWVSHAYFHMWNWRFISHMTFLFRLWNRNISHVKSYGEIIHSSLYVKFFLGKGASCTANVGFNNFHTLLQSFRWARIMWMLLQ
jgi:hypothetical protein